MTNEKIPIKPAYLELGQKIWQQISAEATIAHKYVIAIAGESGSGKSVTAKALQTEIIAHGIECKVLSIDNYFKLPPRANHEARMQDISNVGPQEVNLPLLQSHIGAFKMGVHQIDMPLTNYETDTIEVRTISFADVRILLVEGTYVFTLEHLDQLIFMERTYEQTYQQRAERNRDEMSSFIERVLAIEHEIVVQGKPLADILVNAHYQPIHQK